MNEGPSTPKRVCLGKRDLDLMSKEELQQRWLDQDVYIDALVSGQTGMEGNRQQYEAVRRENVLVMRLTTKEQELQEIASQIEELKRGQNPNTAHLRTMMLDPAINLMFQRMKKETDICREKLEQAQNDLAAWKFTPDGQTGKRLMAKCRMLLAENEELGKIIASGRTAKLEGEIALTKKFVEEMKSSQAETDEFLVEMDEDTEGLTGTIYLLQTQLKEAKEQLSQLQQENLELKSEIQSSQLNSKQLSVELIQPLSTGITTGQQPPLYLQNQTDSSINATAGQLMQHGDSSDAVSTNNRTGNELVGGNPGSSVTSMVHSSGIGADSLTTTTTQQQGQVGNTDPWTGIIVNEYVEPIKVEPIGMIGNLTPQQQPQEGEEEMDTSTNSGIATTTTAAASLSDMAVTPTTIAPTTTTAIGQQEIASDNTFNNHCNNTDINSMSSHHHSPNSTTVGDNNKTRSSPTTTSTTSLTECPISPRTAQSNNATTTKDPVKPESEVIVAPSTKEEPIQNGLISSQYDSQGET